MPAWRVVKAGDPVVVIAGRNRGAKAVVVAEARVPTPSGAEILVVRIRRPRGGEHVEFAHNLRPLE